MGRWHRALEHAAAALEIAEQTLDAHQRIFMGRITALIETDSVTSRKRGTRARKASSLRRRCRTRSTYSRAVACSGDSSSHSATSKPPAPTSATSPGGRSPRIQRPDGAILGRCDRDPLSLGELDHARDYLGAYEQHGARVGDPWAVAVSRVAVAFSPPPRETWQARPPPSSAPSPSWTDNPSRSSAAARCSPSAQSVGKRSRSARPVRR